ncbi:MAG: hypothetical protein Q8O67_07415 [Deltaproteobacteria bacterium]|nr:hypothetical protein [Deltaproteobacteria bacterium]
MNLVIPLMVCAAASSNIANLSALSAVHHGRLEGKRLVWQTHVDVDGPLAYGPSAAWLPLLHPLPRGTLASGDDVVAIYDDDGSVVAVHFTKLEHSRRALRIDVPFDAGDRLQAPLFGAPVERLSLDGLRFEPADALGLRAHLGYRAGDNVTQSDRHHFERVFHLMAREGSIYVTPTAELKAHGLSGSIVVVAEQRGRLALLGLAATAAMAAAMILAYRKLHAAVDAERVDKVIDGRLDELPG